MEGRVYWYAWAQFLQRWGLKNLTASIFTSFSALPVLLAQALYLLQPLIGTSDNSQRYSALAKMLESNVERDLFIEYIIEER